MYICDIVTLCDYVTLCDIVTLCDYVSLLLRCSPHLKTVAAIIAV